MERRSARQHQRAVAATASASAAAAAACAKPARPAVAPLAAPPPAAAPAAQQHAQEGEEQRELERLLAAGPAHAGWAALPAPALERVLNELPLKDLAAAACVCTTWRYEAQLDARWREFWREAVSDVGLWRWAQANGELTAPPPGGVKQQIPTARCSTRAPPCRSSLLLPSPSLSQPGALMHTA